MHGLTGQSSLSCIREADGIGVMFIDSPEEEQLPCFLPGTGLI
jgi:hypothetical protein